MSWRLSALSVALLPGLFAWWSGRRIIGRLGDPALPERLLQRHAHQQLLLVACPAVAMFVTVRYGWITGPLGMLAAWVGDLPLRRVLFGERWSLVTYVGWQARLTLAWFGFWMLLAAAPIVIYELGATLGLPAAFLAVGALIAWNHRYRDVFVRLVRATAIPPRASWEPVLQRARVSRPVLYEMPVPGGRFVNAFALPATDTAVVLLSQSLLEWFDDAEQAAVLAHELAHLEAYDAAKLRRWSLVVDAIAVVSTVGFALVVYLFEDAIPGLIVALVWVGMLLAAAMWWVASHKAHEMDSDARAVALCGDADAVMRALAKLTVLSALPRRWSAEFEAACSHPSLARRIAHVRRVAGIGSLRLEAPVTVAATPPGTFLVFEPDRLLWLEGVPADCARAPEEMSRRAARARVLPYSDLSELRIVAGRFTTAGLVAVDTGGRSWRVLVDPAALPGLQAVLDRIDGLLSHAEVSAIPRDVHRVVAILRVGAVVLGQALGAAMLSMAIALVRPSRAALAGIAAVGLSSVILTIDRSTRATLAARDGVSAVAAVLVIAAAVWLATRRRDRVEPLIDVVVPIAAYAVAAALAWAPLAWEVSRDPAALALGVAIHRTPVVWITALALAASLLALRQRAVRLAAGAAALAVVVVVIAVSIADQRSVATVPAAPGDELRDPRLVAAIELPAGSAGLRSSPGGRRVAVGLPGREKRWLVTGDADADRRVIRGRDLQFVDDDHVLVLAAGDDRHAVRVLDVRDGAVARGPIWIRPLRDPHVAYVRDDTWAVIGTNASESFEAAFGTLGRAEVTYRRWQPDRTAGAWSFRVWALSPEQAVQVVSVPAALSRTPWGPLLYWRSGQSIESRVWRLDGDAPKHLVTWAGGVRCQMPPRAAITLVCTGWRGWEGGVVVWTLDAARGSVGPPLSVPGGIVRWGTDDDGRIFAMQARDVVTVVDLERRSLAHWRLDRPPASVTELLPMRGGFALLGAASDRTILALYETH